MSTVLAGEPVAPEIYEGPPAPPSTHEGKPPQPPAPFEFEFDGGDDAEGRRALRAQILRLEKQIADTFVTGFTMGGILREDDPAGEHTPRVLSFEELERLRDMLTSRLQARRATIAAQADRHEAARMKLERMLEDPASHRYAEVTQEEMGEKGGGYYRVKPRHGVIGAIAGWWQVSAVGCV